MLLMCHSLSFQPVENGPFLARTLLLVGGALTPRSEGGARRARLQSHDLPHRLAIREPIKGTVEVIESDALTQ
jgi:hypothetical protein